MKAIEIQTIEFIEWTDTQISCVFEKKAHWMDIMHPTFELLKIYCIVHTKILNIYNYVWIMKHKLMWHFHLDTFKIQLLISITLMISTTGKLKQNQ